LRDYLKASVKDDTQKSDSVFPFVICARLNKKAVILAGFEQRLKNSREQEIKTALEEILKIAELRLRDLIASRQLK
jgi:2-oxo-4-hydroxy-4-carboxy-5-ureidoimidazoline decarboxylase